MAKEIHICDAYIMGRTGDPFLRQNTSVATDLNSQLAVHCRRLVLITAMAIFSALLALCLLNTVGWATEVPNIGVPLTVIQSWAQYAPFLPVQKYAAPPAECSIVQVSYASFESNLRLTSVLR